MIIRRKQLNEVSFGDVVKNAGKMAKNSASALGKAVKDAKNTKDGKMVTNATNSVLGKDLANINNAVKDAINIKPADYLVCIYVYDGKEIKVSTLKREFTPATQYTSLYDKFKLLSDYTKTSFVRAVGGEEGFEKNEKFPFFELMRNSYAKEILIDDNDTFLKCYNYIVGSNEVTFLIAKNSNPSNNILFIKNLYTKNNYKEIANKYFNTEVKDEWLKDESVGGLSAVDKDFPAYFKEISENYTNKEKFKNAIFYNYDKEVRNLYTITAIIEVLNGKKETSNTEKISKSLTNVDKEEDIKSIVDKLSDNQVSMFKKYLDSRTNNNK